MGIAKDFFSPTKNIIGIDHNLDRARIRKLLTIGMFASVLTGIGDFPLGYAESIACSSLKRFSISPGLMQLLNQLGKQSPLGRSAVRPLIGFGSLACSHLELIQCSFRERFMYRHSMKAPDEMRQLHEQFYHWLE